MAAAAEVTGEACILPPPPPPPPPPPRIVRSRQDSSSPFVCGLSGAARGQPHLRRLPQRMELRLHLRGVHRELLDRIDARHKAQRREAAPSTNTGVRLSSELKSTLAGLPHLAPPPGHTGVHICEVMQVPGLLDMILKEVEHHRHVLRENETPKIKVSPPPSCGTSCDDAH